MKNQEEQERENPLMNLINKNIDDENEINQQNNKYRQNNINPIHQYYNPIINNQSSNKNPKDIEPNYEELLNRFGKLELDESSKIKISSPKKPEQNNYFQNPMMNNNKNNQKEMGAFNYFFGNGMQGGDLSKKIGENPLLGQLGYNLNNEQNIEDNKEEKKENNNYKMNYKYGNNNDINQQEKIMMMKNNNNIKANNNMMSMQMDNNNMNINLNNNNGNNINYNNMDPRIRNIIQQNMMQGNNQNQNQIMMNNYQRNQNNNRKKKNRGNKINNNNNVNIQNMNLIMNQQQIPYNYQYMQNQNMGYIPNQSQPMNINQNYIPNNMNNRYNQINNKMIYPQNEYNPMNMIGMNMNQNTISLDQFIAKANNSFPGKFYVIKSIDESNILSSIRFKIWCSTIKGNQKLQKAYKEADKKYPIFLFFSVNGSGKFMGIALMNSDVEYKVNFNYWSQNDKWKGFFMVDWICIKDVPNKMFRNIINELNENKPVTSSRDTQEICTSAGVRMLKVFRDYPQESTIFDTQNEMKYQMNQREYGYKNNQNMNNNNMNYIPNKGNMMNMGNMNMGNINNNIPNINMNNNRNNMGIINNSNNNNIPNMNIMQNMPNIPNMNPNMNNINNMPNIPNMNNNMNYNQMIKLKENKEEKQMNLNMMKENNNINLMMKLGEEKNEQFDMNNILGKKNEEEEGEEEEDDK